MLITPIVSPIPLPSTPRFTDATPVAPPPFDRKDADFVLRSTDSLDFRIHRAVMEMASPFFADGLDGLDPRNVGMTEDGLPVTHISADSRTLNLILHHIYPLPTTKIYNIDDALDVLRVSREYDFTLVALAMKTTIRNLADLHPLQVYARASLQGCEEEMRVAARMSLRHPILETYIPELETLSAGTYHHLLTYHRECGRVAADVVDNLEWVTDLFNVKHGVPVFFTCSLCPVHKLGKLTDDKDVSEDLYTPMWFHSLLIALKQALQDTPCGSTLDDPELAEQSLAAAMTCLVCRTSALSDCRRFTRVLKELISQAVSKVSYMSF